VKSPGDDNIPRIEHEVKSSNGTVFHSGDILCLKPDLISGKVGDHLQLYQARGFVVSSKLGESVSILPLQRIVEVETSITHFIPRHYRLGELSSKACFVYIYYYYTILRLFCSLTV